MILLRLSDSVQWSSDGGRRGRIAPGGTKEGAAKIGVKYPLSLKLLVWNRVWHEIATQGHSRSFILQPVTGRQGAAYRHII